MSLKGKVALVTGSSKGLGKVIAFALGEAGASVVFNYANNAETAEATFAEYQKGGGHGILVQADVTTQEGIDHLLARAQAELGGIDILIPNATPDQPQRPIEEYDWDFYQQMIDFFIKSPFLLTQAVVPHMKARKWGRIVNITTEAFEKSVPNFSAYCAAKGGQTGFSRSISTELAPFGITVNIVSPGWVPVERHADDPQEDKDAYLAGIPLGRWGTPADIANAILFFCREESGFITGQTLSVNGGNAQAR